MEALGFTLFVVVTIAWVWPESFGRWLRRVKDGYGPINVTYNTYIHTKDPDHDR